MIVTPECASAHIRGRYKSKRLLRSRIRRRRRSGMTSSRRAASAVQDGRPDWRSMPQSIPRSTGHGRHRDRRPKRASSHSAGRNRFRFCAGRASPTRCVPMIVTPECASAHIRGRYKSKRLLRSRIRRRRRSGMTSSRRAASAVQDGMARLAKHASKHPAFNRMRASSCSSPGTRLGASQPVPILRGPR